METKQVIAGLNEYMDGLAATLKQLDTAQLAQIVAVLLEAQENGKNVFTMGNGGHGNTAAHMINDIAKHTVSSDDKDSVVTAKRFRTMCLNDSMSLLTGVANDMGYDHVFSEQLKNWCQAGDVVIGISGSGNSPNVLNAFDVAKQLGAHDHLFFRKRRRQVQAAGGHLRGRALRQDGADRGRPPGDQSCRGRRTEKGRATEDQTYGISHADQRTRTRGNFAADAANPPF